MNQLALMRDERPVGVAQVEPVDQFPVYELGAALQSLKDLRGRNEVNSFDQLIALTEAETHLDQLLEGREFAIDICQPSAHQLKEKVRGILATFFEDDKEQLTVPDDALPTWHFNMLHQSIETFEHQFSAELKKIGTYLVPERGIFNTAGLMDGADNHIHESVREAVPEFARSEFRKAGRCLAFGLYSASGFHSARAVECVLRSYYGIFMGQSPKKNDAGLGLMASHLNNLFEKKDPPARLPQKNTVRHLRDFANFDRNPLIHPSAQLDLEEIDAQTLFNSAQGVIVEMAKELKAEKSKPKALPSTGLALTSAPAPAQPKY